MNTMGPGIQESDFRIEPILASGFWLLAPEFFSLKTPTQLPMNRVRKLRYNCLRIAV